jgi:hypothetical protein
MGSSSISSNGTARTNEPININRTTGKKKNSTGDGGLFLRTWVNQIDNRYFSRATKIAQ